ncbi:hypothetical protein FPZ43_06160 [Mucilaginibacter pallidiroseus]|uniref:TonB C-terminal domain-containing protein n=1 Tax=Mucilaginibacter pallidiroseus TaxID=2599295 RepID=A0A563UGK4_9SPHI|nr:carboxypeptidase-like regulatory domain-containing protein [Mucilaginibacter pallidiroseus]TWR30520.1 hypothetical protein FPZ43_06160 [Mucilaginibacter pallidiroseus]
MENKRANISQIRKYLNGELDAKAMHQLELEAQHDPFLMDALEGYTPKPDNIDTGLADLNQRLANRTQPAKVKQLIPWLSIAIAAGVIGFMIVAGIFYNTRQPQQPNVVANNVPVDKSVTPQLATPREQISDSVTLSVTNPTSLAASPGKKYNNAKTIAAQGNTVSRYNKAQPAATTPDRTLGDKPEITNPLLKSDSMPLDEMVVLTYTSRKKDSTVKPDMPATVAIAKRPQSQSINSKAEGVAVPQPVGKKEDLNKYGLGYLAPKTPSAGLIAGRVTSQTDGQPLPGVTVKVDGKNTAAQTDANGYFKVSAVKDKETLTISYLGYQTKTVKPGDSVNVALTEQHNSLNEVVVVSKPNNDITDINKAHPQTGWQAFKNYLYQGAKLTDGKAKGTVKLKFTITEDGSVSDIIIVKGLDAESNKRAIELIKNGPGWISNINGKPETVTVAVDFHK